jgi:hypothetical protein
LRDTEIEGELEEESNKLKGKDVELESNVKKLEEVKTANRDLKILITILKRKNEKRKAIIKTEVRGFI